MSEEHIKAIEIMMRQRDAAWAARDAIASAARGCLQWWERNQPVPVKMMANLRAALAAIDEDNAELNRLFRATNKTRPPYA